MAQVIQKMDIWIVPLEIVAVGKTVQDVHGVIKCSLKLYLANGSQWLRQLIRNQEQVVIVHMVQK